jgi:molybdopterin-guanine dinucleotide biosynthesis protein A
MYPSALRLGAVLAGGQSRRFGSPKQIAELDGTRLIESVARALRAAGAHAVAITGLDLPDLSHLLPCRVDVLPGRGPLGGVHTALVWARELGLTGTLCVACDTPFIPTTLLRKIAEIGEASPGSVVAAETTDPRGLEPLCAWYPTAAIQEIEVRLGEARLSLTSLLETLPVRRIPLDEVRAHGNPEKSFFNINTPADRDRAAGFRTSGESANDAR